MPLFTDVYTDEHIYVRQYTPDTDLPYLCIYTKYGDLIGKIYSDRSRSDWKGLADIFISKTLQQYLHSIADTLQ